MSRFSPANASYLAAGCFCILMALPGYAATVTKKQGELRVFGTPGRDVLFITVTATELQVREMNPFGAVTRVPLSSAKKLTILLGDGDDTVNFSNVPSIGMALQVDLGPGADHFLVDELNEVASLTVVDGPAHDPRPDVVQIGKLDVTGDLTIFCAAGNDLVTLGNDLSEIGGSLNLSMGEGDDFLGLFGLVIRDDMLVMLDGGSDVVFAGSLDVAGLPLMDGGQQAGKLIQSLIDPLGGDLLIVFDFFSFGLDLYETSIGFEHEYDAFTDLSGGVVGDNSMEEALTELLQSRGFEDVNG